MDPPDSRIRDVGFVAPTAEVSRTLASGALATPHFAGGSFRARVARSYRAVFVDHWPCWAATLVAAVLNVFAQPWRN